MSEIQKSGSRLAPATLLASVVAVAICLFGNLGAIGLVGPDEPRYAWIARAMAQTGDWVTPRLYGQPWFEKPILYYWAAAAGFHLRLPAEWAARLPSALAALAAALAIGWLGRKHYGGDTSSLASPALLAPLLFSSSVAAIGFARSAGPDMLFAASITLAMASAARLFRRAGALRGESATSRSDSLPLLLFGCFLGLAALAKGPAAVVLAGGTIGLWAIATGQWRAAFRAAHPVAIAAFCVVALPWYVVCALRNPDFIRVFIFQHNFQRYLTPLFQHRQPFWFFGPILLLALLPWTALLWPATEEALRMWREHSWKNSPGLFFACWTAFPVLFFSLSQSKLPGYILPAIPPMALLLAVALARATGTNSATQQRSLRTIGVALGITWIVLGIVAMVWASRLPQTARDAAGRPIFITAILAIAGGIGVAAIALLHRRAFIALALALAVLCVAAAGLRILPALDASFSARWHGQLLRDDARPDRIFTYRLQRSWIYGLEFYLGREIDEWSQADRESALVLTTPGGLREMRRLGRVHGDLEESYRGIVYAPVAPATH
ncbi:MAG TPA: phospholipid carrier-dependent glycosyltransferase [Candidatus Acidoferrales bacterium]|nr:phospholipid carrier-dependent glycosyltransferase [Candidatus Acidoferrales bacterium]